MSYYGWTPEKLELGVKLGEIWYAIMIPSDSPSNEDMKETAEVEE